MSSEANGTQTATVTTEHTLHTTTNAGTYVLDVDLTNLANGDTVELRAKKKCLTGGSEILYLLGTYSHAQGAPLVSTIPIHSEYSLKVTLKQTVGTSRDFPWNLNKL